MNNKRAAWKLLACVFSLGLLVSAGQAAQNQPVEVTGDIIEYDATQGSVTASGNIRMIQGDLVVTGSQVTYNTKNATGNVTGGVTAVQKDATLVADSLNIQSQQVLVAQGNPVLTKGESRLTGPQIEYRSGTSYALVQGWAHLSMPDGIMKANQIEAFFAENRAVAQGNVKIDSQTRRLTASADQAVYYGGAGQGKTVLTGQARAVQDGNVLTGNSLTIYLDEKKMDAQGRTTLVVIPE